MLLLGGTFKNNSDVITWTTVKWAGDFEEFKQIKAKMEAHFNNLKQKANARLIITPLENQHC